MQEHLGTSNLIPALDRLGPHDHACLLHQPSEEWPAGAIASFFQVGLQRREKCLYFVETHRADELRSLLYEAGLDIAPLEADGRVVLHESETYTKRLSFDPSRRVALLIDEAERASEEGYRGLRVSDEMSWALPGRPGSEKVLEHEALLNRDFFPRYSCVALCQYDSGRFDPEIIKGAIMTHPLVVVGGSVHENPYYIPPEDYLSDRRAQREVECWLRGFRAERTSQQLLDTVHDTVVELTQALESRDPFSAGHQLRVTTLACAIAEEMALSPAQVEMVRQAGKLHDIGKIRVPADILTKPRTLTPAELEEVRVHPQASYELLGKLGYPPPIPEVALQHHERMDGSGYPQGLLGEDILVEARVLAVADVVEAMSFGRAHRGPLGLAKALQDISWNKDTLYDPYAVDACVRLFTDRGFRFR